VGNQEYNGGKKYRQKGTLCGPNNTHVQMYEEFTHEPSPVDTPVQVYDEFTHEPSPVDTPVQVYDEFTHESSPVNTPIQRPDEFTHVSSPQTKQGHGKKFESYYEISSSRSLRPMVIILENMNQRLKEKLHEYAILDQHIKTENELMKLRQAHFSSKIERLK
jgi:hypothetical protein